MANKKPWYVVWDGTYTYIAQDEKSAADEDSQEFPTFTAAKEAVLTDARSRAEESRQFLRHVKSWRKTKTV